MPGVKRTITINAPQQEVYGVISDFETYPDFQPEVNDVEVLDKSNTKAKVTFTLQLILKIKCTLAFKMKKPSLITWSMVDGQMISHNNGSWKLIPVSKNKTKVEYSIDVGVGPLVPKSIINTLVDINLPKMLENFKDYIEG